MQNAVFVVIIAILALPLIFNRHEALVVVPALGALFVLGFIGPFLDMYGHIALAVLGLAIVIATPITVGRFARSGGTAFVAGAAFGMFTWLAIGFGIYFVRQTGWHGLTEWGSRSSDQPGVAAVWFVFIAGAFIWLSLALICGVMAAWVNSRR
jgi:hypothetical protein